MTWLKVDDRLHDHRKARKAGTHAMGLWVLCGSWAAAYETDGFVPTDIVRRWGSDALARRLVDSGLWETAVVDGERGYRFHDWHVVNPTRAQLETERERARERMRAVRANGEQHKPRTTRARSATPTRPVLLPPSPSVERCPEHAGQPLRGCRGCASDTKAAGA